MRTFFPLVLVLSIALVLSACADAAPVVTLPASQAGTRKPTRKEGGYGSAGDRGAPENEDDAEPEPANPWVYEPSDGMTARETVEAYFEQQYQAYAALQYIDTSAIHDMTLSSGRNAELWYEMLVQRRRLIYENDFCYVDTAMYPYTITYLEEEELEDDRIAFWQERNTDLGDETMIHLVVTGEAGVAYPPMMAINAQHSIRMRRVDGVWKIIFHYYPGAVRRYRRGGIERQSEEEMLHAIADVFDFPSDNTPYETGTGHPYTGAYAAWYAAQYVEHSNPNFYSIIDWMGNCANFTSQCIWYGFSEGEDEAPNPGPPMTSAWYAGEGGGTPAWENTEYFWQWATTGGELRMRELYSVNDLAAGDLIQLRTGGITESEEDDYNHSMIVVDAQTLLFAQNSPDCLVYYCDLLNVQTRMLRPLGLVG